MNRPTSFDELYKGRFLKAGLLQGRHVTLTIADVYLEELEGEKGKEEKAIIAFEGKQMQLVLCKLNGLCLKAMFGVSIPAWRGKRITIFPTDEIAPMKRGEPCIRVWGSPDIEKDMIVPIQLPKRKAFNVTLRRVSPAGQSQPTNSPQDPQ